VGSTAMVGVWASGVAAALLFAGLAWWLAPLEPGVLALQFAFSPRAFGAVVHQWSAADLARYRAHLPVDMLLLLSYAVFGHRLATRTALFTGHSGGLQRRVRWLLPLAACFDALENALHAWLTEAPRFGAPAVYAVSAGASATKWLLIAGFALLCWHALGRRRD
jgi:hypothetical protein